MTKEEILTELSTSRAALSREYVALRTELDFKSKLNALVRRKPYAWLSGAAAIGWFLAGPKTKTRVVTKVVKDDGKPIVVKEKKKGSVGLVALLLGVMRFVFPIVRPALTNYASRFFSEMATRRPR
ncbi:MAG TPA: hypothetical protein VIS99_05960 [Terrimicrobiaceae bacterium]